jgi:hypothetical protein
MLVMVLGRPLVPALVHELVLVQVLPQELPQEHVPAQANDPESMQKMQRFQ